MIAFPNAKINLGLHVRARRPDGYHELETVFVPIPLCDVLEIIDAPQTSFHFSGLSIPGQIEENLLFKVFHTFQNDFKLPNQKVLLHKVIPMGAGLGGGSSDAAFLMKLLNEKFTLGLSISELQRYAGSFGADCAFFIENKTVLAKGIGNEFSPITLTNKAHDLVLVKPDVHVSTAMAFAGVKPKQPEASLNKILTESIDFWKEHLINDFEEGIFALYPKLAVIKKQLYALGAKYAAMSGSGSTIFGLFESKPDLESLGSNNFVFSEKIKF